MHSNILTILLVALPASSFSRPAPSPRSAFAPPFSHPGRAAKTIGPSLSRSGPPLPSVRPASVPEKGNADGTPRRRRRVRYAGKYPRNFSEKYKEHAGDTEVVRRVLEKGNTPAGTHVPIMSAECMERLGLAGGGVGPDTLVVDCTLGYGGHASRVLERLASGQGGRLIGFDRDPLEIAKTDARLRERLIPAGAPGDSAVLTTVNQNFSTLGAYLESTGETGHVTSLLADLGLSSMQIDDNERGFTFKREGPLDMRMDAGDGTTSESAYALLSRIRPRDLSRLLEENSDEEFATEIALGLLDGGKRKIPKTTVELAERVREIVRPLLRTDEKKQVDSTIARVMQAIRIEVNGEFRALETLLNDLPSILAPGGSAVFLTFHSGEDRRVKKSFKAGFKSGIYESWSRHVVRPGAEERRNNPRSSCCKLRWAVRSLNAP
mmetsp:Transcript_11727/g.23356  ORF Transcript_11727/g.23356 Transcript_11727/m.23356 type:complete len:436 (+) Transcript_11727:685-1992(+)